MRFLQEIEHEQPGYRPPRLMESFTPFSSLAGGALIGLAAGLLMLGLGRIAGISGILQGVLARPGGSEWGWRASFVAGLVVAPVLVGLVLGEMPAVHIDASMARMAVAGLVVGFGTALGSGCTSGHGVCGLARLSRRSLVATPVFMVSAMLTVFVTRHVIGG